MAGRQEVSFCRKTARRQPAPTPETFLLFTKRGRRRRFGALAIAGGEAIVPFLGLARPVNSIDRFKSLFARRTVSPRCLSRLCYCGAALVALAACGCDPKAGTTPNARGPQLAESGERVAAVEIASWDQLQSRRERFRGKVVVIDVWSTYCEPCVREFPGLVELQKRFGDKVACISFNTDYAGAKDEPPESFRPRVLSFLNSRRAFFENVISSEPSEEFYDKIHLGGPPAVFVYDRTGRFVRCFDNSKAPKVPEFTYQHDVAPLVEKLSADST